MGQTLVWVAKKKKKKGRLVQGASLAKHLGGEMESNSAGDSRVSQAVCILPTVWVPPLLVER